MENKSISVTLTLTEEEIELLKRALITELVDCSNTIKTGPSTRRATS